MQKVQEFLNQVPNNKYGDNYLLASQFKEYITNTNVLFNNAIDILETIKSDAKMAIKGQWAVDYTNNESMEGFNCQISLINSLLKKLK